MTENSPHRGEIWLVNFDPTIGAEIQKTRPGVVISSDSLGKLPLRIIAPVTGWRKEFEHNVWHVKLCSSRTNGLQKDSAVDLLQVRSMDARRLMHRLGRVTVDEMKEMLFALMNVVEFVDD